MQSSMPMKTPGPTLVAALAVLTLAAAPALAARGAMPPATFAIEHVTLIDGTGAAARPDSTVLVVAGRIKAVGAAGMRLPWRTQRVDGRGRYLIPGLMDMHIHLLGGGAWKDTSAQSAKPLDFDVGVSTLQGFLYYGITSVYDAGNNPDFILPLRERERAGEIVAPRIFATGQLLTYPGSWSVGYAGIGVRDWPDTIKDLDLQIARKPDLQKITYEAHGVGPNPLIPALPRDLMAKEIAYLHAHGIRTTVHISNERMARDAIEAGIDTMAHIPSVGVVSQEFIRLAADKRIPMQTSMSVFDEISQMDRGIDFLNTPEYRAVLDPREYAVREIARGRYLKLGWPGWFQVLLPYVKRNIKAIHDGGGLLVLATDRTFAPALLREIELVVESGISPIDAIRIGTLNGAIFLGRERDMGSIEPGKFADLVLLAADPVADIRNVRTVQRVWKGGVEIDRGRLDLPVNRTVAAH